MTLRPSLHLILDAPTAPHTLDFFPNLVRLFSSKSVLNAINSDLRGNMIASSGLYDARVRVRSVKVGWNIQAGRVILYPSLAPSLLRLQVRPWHVTSMLTRMRACSPSALAPERFWVYALTLFYRTDVLYFDVPTANLTPTQLRAKLAALAESLSHYCARGV